MGDYHGKYINIRGYRPTVGWSICTNCTWKKERKASVFEYWKVIAIIISQFLKHQLKVSAGHKLIHEGCITPEIPRGGPSPVPDTN